MKKLILGLSLVCSLSFSDTVELKKGWNLIGVSSNLLSSSLVNNTHILSATGGGVGGGANFTYNKEYSQYASGNFILGQGYWIKVDSDTTLEYTKASNIPSSVMLKKGWNLIHPLDTLLATDLIQHTEILSATGGGVGGGANFTYNKEYSQYASGETLSGQGYWLKVSDDMELVFTGYDYRAWGVGGDDINSMASIRINGIEYSVLVYSKLEIEQSNSDNSGNYTSFLGTIFDKTPSQIKISGDYENKEVKFKLFSSDTVFDDTTLVAQTDTFLANNSYVDYGNITFVNPNDYSVPQPTDTNQDLLPPVSPTF